MCTATDSVSTGLGTGSKRALLYTMLTAVLLLLVLEIRSPYYFLQDDNLEEHLPAYVHNWRSLLNGELPLYNFHTFAGIPHASMPEAAPLNLIQYPALLLSYSIWGHPFAAIDLMAFMHGLLAVAGGYLLLRRLGVTEFACGFGALTALSAFFVWWGQMWISATALAAWFPWIIWAGIGYLEKPSVGRAMLLTLLRIGLLFSGYPQWFVLATIFEYLFLVTYSAAARAPEWRKRVCDYIALLIPTALLGAVYWVPALAETARSLDRSAPLSYVEFSSLAMPLFAWMWGQVLVFISILPTDNIQSSAFFVSHVGFVTTLLSAGVFERWSKDRKRRAVIFACGACFLIALFWGANVLAPLIYKIPMLNRFRWPFKLVYFAGFFQCVMAALVLERWSKRGQRLAIACFLAGWIWVFCFLPDHAWRLREYHPPLHSSWQTVLKNGRYLVISHGPVYYVSKELVELDYSELWGLDNLLGYEPMLSRSAAQLTFGKVYPSPDLHAGSYKGPVDKVLVDRLRRLSVRYVLVSAGRNDASATLSYYGFVLRSMNERGWALWEDPASVPRVHWAALPSHDASALGIQWVEHASSIEVTLSRWPARELIFAFGGNPDLEACVGGNCAAVADSSDGLVHVTVPNGTRQVRLVYRNRLLELGGWISIAALGGFVIVIFVANFGSRQVQQAVFARLCPFHTTLFRDGPRRTRRWESRNPMG